MVPLTVHVALLAAREPLTPDLPNAPYKRQLATLLFRRLKTGSRAELLWFFSRPLRVERGYTTFGPALVSRKKVYEAKVMTKALNRHPTPILITK
jgi:hypothetical protein